MTAWCWASEVDKTNTFILASSVAQASLSDPSPRSRGTAPRLIVAPLCGTAQTKASTKWQTPKPSTKWRSVPRGYRRVPRGARTRRSSTTQHSPCPTPNFHTTPSDVRRWAANALHRACLPGSHARGAWERSALLVARLMPTIDCCMFQADACIRGRSVRWPVAAVNSPPGKPTTSGRHTNVSAGRGQNSGYE